MFDLIFKPFGVLFDNSKRLSNRLFYFIVVIIFMVILNDYTGFLENYIVMSRLEQIKALKELRVEHSDFDSEIIELTGQNNESEKFTGKTCFIVYSN